jgi:hypothetical protein
MELADGLQCPIRRSVGRRPIATRNPRRPGDTPWRRVAAFAAVAIAHLLGARFFIAGFAALPEAPEQEISFAILMAPDTLEEQTLRARPLSQGAAKSAKSSARRKETVRSPDTLPLNQPVPGTAPLFIDWAKEAEIAADDTLRRDAETERQAGALSPWRLRVIPPSHPPASGFSWDYARTHRLESSAQGLVVNLNDRCSVLISIYFMAVMGGCKLGELPVHGDLFLHMNDDPQR